MIPVEQLVIRLVYDTLLTNHIKVGRKDGVVVFGRDKLPVYPQMEWSRFLCRWVV